MKQITVSVSVVGRLVRFLGLGVILLAGLSGGPVFAEPYLAVRTGQKCMACHVNPSGGGKRTNFGKIYGQTILPSQSATTLLVEQVSNYLDIGADMRGSTDLSLEPGKDEQLAFATDRATVYVEATLVPNRVSVYLDQRFAPGASNREAWMLLRTKSQRTFLQAGSFYLPYGLRLEDDGAFIREVTGVSFNNADNGILVGHDAGPWSFRTSLTNGTNGGSETNMAKQISLRAVYVKPRWRIGASANFNDGSDAEARQMANVFGGLKLLGLDWLAELDLVRDTAPGINERNQYIGFLEANKELHKGHNLKASVEWLDPDTEVGANLQSRTSLVYEFTPLPMVQLRLGTRIRDGIPQNSSQNTDTVFGQLHVWF